MGVFCKKKNREESLSFADFTKNIYISTEHVVRDSPDPKRGPWKWGDPELINLSVNRPAKSTC